MLFVWIGLLKSADSIGPDMQEQISEFLQQPYITIGSAGVLRNATGQRSGYMMTFEAENRSAAEALVATSPIRKAGLYEEFHLFEFQDEVG